MDSFSDAVAKGTHSQDGWPSSAYMVAKAGMIGFTRVLESQEEWTKKGLGINACCPGWVVTDMTKGRGAKNVDQGAQTPVLLSLGDLQGRNGEFWQDERVLRWD